MVLFSLSQREKRRKEIELQLSIKNSDQLEFLRQNAEKTLFSQCGKQVSLRGLVEFSNVCIRDCHYCGIRKSNRLISRYAMTAEEIIRIAKDCVKKEYGSLVLQCGERQTPAFTDFLMDTVSEIKRQTRSTTLPDGLGITLSAGEQSADSYQRLFDAGVHRYLLRIETSSPDLFSRLHPKEQRWENRVNCLRILKNIGYQVGSGVMIGLPGQTITQLADDILFFMEMGIDMIGMGPYLPCANTPMQNQPVQNAENRFLLGLKMIAATRLAMPDINIAATTALQTLNPEGRKLGLQFGANVLMFQMTPPSFGRLYTLYERKPVQDADDILALLSQTGRQAAVNQWGDSRRFYKQNHSLTKNITV